MPSHGGSHSMDGSKFDSSIAASLLHNEDGVDFALVRNIQYLIAAACSLFCAAAYIITYQKQEERVFRAASRTFLFIMFLGSQFSWIALAINAGLDFYPDVCLCYAIFTADMIGFSIVFGCLIVKSLRLVQFLKIPHSLPKYTDYFLIKLLAGYIITAIGICALTYTIPLVQEPSFVVYSQYLTEDDNFSRQCDMGSLSHIKLIFQAVSAMAGLVICYNTSNIPAPFREGIWISRCIYNYVGSIFGFGVYLALSPDPKLIVRLVGQYGNIIGSQLIAVGMMLIPKLFVPKTIGLVKKGLLRPSSQITIITPEPVFIQSKPIVSEMKGSTSTPSGSAVDSIQGVDDIR